MPLGCPKYLLCSGMKDAAGFLMFRKRCIGAVQEVVVKITYMIAFYIPDIKMA
jgi:hypothetical protein